MTQYDQTGFLKKNGSLKSGVFAMAAFSLVLGCGVQKSQSKQAPKSDVKSEKSLEEELKEKTTKNQEEKIEAKVTADQLVSYALSKGLLPKNTDATVVKIADLSRFSGKEDQCAFYELASSYVCAENDTLFADSVVGGVEWHVRPPKRIHLPEIPNPFEAVQKEIENKARSLAESFHNSNPNADQQDCIVMVAAGLAAWGAASGAGPIGAAVAAGGGVAAAGIACRAWYP